MSGSLLRKFGRGLALVGLELRVRLFGKDLKSTTTAPTDGQVLRYVAADDAWSPGTASGGGSLPAGTNGSVLAYAAGAWASTGAGTERQILTSAGVGAPTWGADVLPLTQRAVDGLGTSVTTCAVIAHDLAAGGGGAGIGARCELQARNSASTLVAAAGVDGVLTDATGGAEVGVLDLRVRSGGVLAAQLRVSTDTLSTYTGAAWVPLFARSVGEWVYGSTDSANGGSAVLQSPSSGGGLYLRMGAINHLFVNSAGALVAGNTSYQTTLAGARIVLNGPIAVHDANNASVVTAATIAHTLSSGVAGAGIGARVTLAAHNAAGTLTDAAALDGILTNTGAGTEAGAFAISTRTAGGALTERLRVHGAGGMTIGVTAAPTNANDVGHAAGAALLWRNTGNTAWFTALSVTGTGTVVLGDSVGSGGAVQVIPGSTTYFAIYSTNQPRWTHFGHLTQSSGTGTHVAQAPVIQQSGTAGWTLLDLAPALVSEGSGTKRAISYSVSGTERFGLDQNGCFVGLRLKRTEVTDAAHTVAALSCYVDMVGLTAARTVTGPSTPVQAGTVVVITNGDGSASAAKTVTFAPASGTVNGSATHVAIAAAYGSCTYVCDGTNWTVVAKV